MPLQTARAASRIVKVFPDPDGPQKNPEPFSGRMSSIM